MNLEIRVRPLGGPALVRDYHAGSAGLAPFFTGWPWDPEAYLRKAEEVDRRFAAGRRTLTAEAIRASGPEAAAQLERVLWSDGFFVTTGQQAGLFTGPLFTIYKILGAVRLARALEPLLGRPVAPLFWIASDDHDWAEVNHTYVLDLRNELVRIELAAPPGASPVSMGRRRLGPEVEEARARLAALLPRTEFADDVLAPLHAAYRPGRTMAEAFGDLVAELFAPFGLLVVDAAHPVVKARAGEVLARELAQWAEHEALLAAQTERLVAAGYHAQVGLVPGASNVFLEDDEGRDRLVRDGDGWALRRSGRRFSEPELRALLARDPERFSPNVLLRPVVESQLFPTVAYVAGPAELSYYAQVGCLFRAHGVEMPLVYPRPSVLLIEAKVRKVLDKFRLDPEELRRPLHEVAARVLRDELPAEVAEALAGLRAALEAGYGRLAAAAMAIDRTLEGPVLGARNAAAVQLEALEKRIVQQLKRQNATSLEQLAKAQANLCPLGQPQERVLNVYPYLVRYGRGLLDAVHDALAVELGAGAPGWEGVRCG